MKKNWNPILDETTLNLERAYKKSRARIWLRVKELLLKTRSRKPSVNISKISKLTSDGDLVLVPGKVLGDGLISHKLIIGAFSFSEKSLEKIQKVGGQSLSLIDFSKKYTDGKKVVLIGG
jgi:large subunit ribosomal protein L18e